MPRRASERLWGKVLCVLAVVAATGWAIVYHFAWGQAASTTFAVYILVTVVMLYSLVAATKGRSFRHLPPAAGRVLMIVPVYNEVPALLERTVRSLLTQSRPPDAVHVMDDGSVIPVVPFEHELVTWHRQPNLGKRRAQANVLTRLGPDSFDFVVTVDSDSVLHRDALAHLLRAMSDQRVQAASGLTLVLNRSAKLITRVLDLEIVTWCLVTRMARSVLGAVAPTSGNLAIYRKGLIDDNLDDYVSSGTAGDDRRLTHYALQRGQVVAVSEARVYSSMPETLGELYRQRTRWFKSYWRYLFWELEHFSLVPFLLRLYALLFVVLSPVVLVGIVIFFPGAGKLVLLPALGYWAVMTWAQTGMYAAMRPELDLRTRLLAWLFLTPLLSLMNMFVIKPALYWAILKAKNTAWQTRSDQDSAGTKAALAARRVASYSGAAVEP